MSGPGSFSRLDKALHKAAFASTSAQLSLADIERQLYRRDMAGIAVERPVFVTSLPRAGTTLLLEILSGLPDFATYTYRQMPFVLCPLIWNRISRGFRKEATLAERAHGDGMAVGYDSPEAFEEVIWKAFWRERYSERIQPWRVEDRDAEFEEFLRNHMRKVILLQGATGPAGRQRRYLSKNNANIARLRLLSELFPDSSILIPVRNPWGQAQSLLRQHRRFTEMHAKDAFAHQYMEWLGHYEFGAALKPIDLGGWFRGWTERPGPDDPNDIAFWLSYWHAAFTAILAEAGPNVSFVDYDRLCREPRPILQALASTLDIADSGPLLNQAERLHRPTQYAAPDTAGDQELRWQIETLYERIRTSSLGALQATA